MKKFENPKFYRLLAGLNLLNDYKPSNTYFNPSQSLSIIIENHPVNKPDTAKLLELGWEKESAVGDSWIFN